MIFLPFVLLCSLFAAAITSSDTYTCDDNPYLKGCTVSKGSEWYGKKLKKACNKHDLCNQCGYTQLVTPAMCDSRFHSNLKKSCPKKKKGLKAIVKNLKRAECLLAAATYFTAIRLGGVAHKYWKFKAYDHCTQPWVKKCIS